MKFRQLNFIKILKILYLDSKTVTISGPAKGKTKSLLIVRMDAIGDYILFRNFLEIIRNSEMFREYKITLCGNEIWREITETFDRPFIDDCIWINRNKFKTDRNYRNEKLKYITSIGFEFAIETTTSREMFFGDAIIRATKAPFRIGKKGDTCNTIGFWKFFTDSYYTRLINVREHTFEFDSNKKLFEKIVNTEIHLRSTYLNLPLQPEKKTIILFPGASEKTKQWSPENFAIVANYILKNTSSEIIISGAKNDSKLAELILENITEQKERIKNLCGTTNLPQLIDLISGATFLISSDTSAFHIGLAVKTISIGLFDGRHFGRFAPYPNVSENEAAFLYPPPIGDYKTTYDYWVRENNEKNLGFTINDINPEYVITQFVKVNK